MSKKNLKFKYILFIDTSIMRDGPRLVTFPWRMLSMMEPQHIAVGKV